MIDPDPAHPPVTQDSVYAWVGLGSNIGTDDMKLDMLHRSIERLRQTPGVGVKGVSSTYRTPPWGVTDQPDFLNAVTLTQTSLSPLELFRRLKEIELALGRQKRFRWGPREIDLDLLLYGDQVVDLPELQVPHPRMLERAFVVVPLLEVTPDVELPGGIKVREAAACSLQLEPFSKLNMHDAE